MSPSSSPILVPPRYATPFVVRRKFQGIVGKRRAGENLEVLTQAHAAYMGLKQNAPLIRGRGANVFTQWVGDPDALGRRHVGELRVPAVLHRHHVAYRLVLDRLELIASMKATGSQFFRVITDPCIMHFARPQQAAYVVCAVRCRCCHFALPACQLT